MVPMSVEEIAKAVDGRLIGDAGSESRATNTVSDSRQAGPGSGFVAIRGARVGGHDFGENRWTGSHGGHRRP